MPTYTTFMKPEKLNINPESPLVLARRRVYFATKGLDAGNGDVHQLIPLISGDVVLNSWIDVIIACPEFSTVDLGYGDIPNFWGNGLRLDTIGPVKTILTATKMMNWIDLPASGGMDMTEVELAGCALDDPVTVSGSIFTQDLILTGHVSDSRFDRVTVQLLNQTGEKMDLASMTLKVVVNKAPLAGQPLMVDSAETIDIAATTDGMDMNITSGVIDVYALILRK